MRTTVMLILASLTWTLVQGGPVAAQTSQPRRSLVGGAWRGTIRQADVEVQVKVAFFKDNTYTSTLTMPGWGPFPPSVTYAAGKWWMEDASTLVMLGSGGPSFRGTIHWINDDNLETYEPLTGTRGKWKRMR